MPQPVLAYNRIEKNRRNTAALLALVPLILLPFAGGIVVYVLPWLVLVVAPSLLAAAGLSYRLLIDHPGVFDLVAKYSTGTLLLGIMTLGTMWNASRYRAAMLRATGAIPLAREEEPDLWRIVEKLCIGAGLPPPRLYVVDSLEPNAFATGTDPAHASLGVTRGLLTLLQPRELEGVIAHGLSHIGNEDIRLSTAVAAVIATVRVPISIVTGIYRTLGTFRLGFGSGFLVIFFGFISLLTTLSVVSMKFLASMGVPAWVMWRQVFTTVAPWYVLFGAPAIGLFVRQAISRQREFLADADAVVLTRDPEGLALALAKIGAWSGPRTFNVGTSAAHLCIADPLPTNSVWWDTIFPCHPSMKDRINMLSSMGNGIPESALQAAARTGATAGLNSIYDAAVPTNLERSTPRIRVRGWNSAGPHATPVYAEPDGWSKVVCNLPERTEVTLCGTEGNFLKVMTADGTVGYVVESAREHLIAHDTRVDLKTSADHGPKADAQPRQSAPVLLFTAADTWSCVLCELPDDAVVTYCGAEGRFLRVMTTDNIVGYVVASACTPSRVSS